MTDKTFLFFIATYLAQGLVGVAYEPIYYLQKDVMGLSVAQSGAFAAVMTLPFLLKPLLGVFADILPAGRIGRVAGLAAAAAGTSLAWLALALAPSYPLRATLAMLTAVNVGIAFVDVLCDGYMVERGKRLKKTGVYQSVQIGALYLCLFATGLGGGWLAAHASYRNIFALTACFPLLILGTLGTIDEAAPDGGKVSVKKYFQGLREMLVRPVFWAAAAIILLFNFKPYLGTARFYYQNDALGFSKLLVGTLNSVDGLAGIAGAGLFWWLLDRRIVLAGRLFLMNTETLVRASVWAGVPLSFLWLAYRTPLAAILITAFFGAAGVAMRLSLMDLAAKSCPPRGEATAFAIFMSVFNLAAWGSNSLGAAVYGRMGAASRPHEAMASLILVGALCTAACGPLLRWISPKPEGAA